MYIHTHTLHSLTCFFNSKCNSLLESTVRLPQMRIVVKIYDQKIQVSMSDKDTRFIICACPEQVEYAVETLKPGHRKVKFF